jgi:hypothetical protein
MNSAVGQFLALAFTACFMVMQLQPIDVHEPVQRDNNISHFEELYTSNSDDGSNRYIDSSTGYSQQFASTNLDFHQQTIDDYQHRQYLSNIERQLSQPFKEFNFVCLAEYCQEYEIRLSTLYIHLQHVQLSLEPHLIQFSYFKQNLSRDAYSLFSLS